MIVRILPLWLLLPALLGLPAPLRAGDEALRFRPPSLKAGKAFETRRTSKLSLVLIVPRPGEREEAVPYTLETEEVFSARVEEVSKGRPQRMEIGVETCARIATSPILAGSTTRTDPGQGETFVVAQGEDSVEVSALASETRAALDPSPALRDRLVRLFSLSWTVLVPEGEVAVGTSWELSGTDVASLLPGIGRGALREGSAKLRLAKTGSSTAGRTAEIEIVSLNAVLDGGDAGARIVLEGAGTLTFGLDVGMPIAIVVEGEAALEGSVGNSSGSGRFEAREGTSPQGE